MKKTYHGWLFASQGIFYVEYIGKNGKRVKKRMSRKGEVEAGIEAVNFWKKRAGEDFLLEPLIGGMYRVYTEKEKSSGKRRKQ